MPLNSVCQIMQSVNVDGVELLTSLSSRRCRRLPVVSVPNMPQDTPDRTVAISIWPLSNHIARETKCKDRVKQNKKSGEVECAPKNTSFGAYNFVVILAWRFSIICTLWLNTLQGEGRKINLRDKETQKGER